MLENTDIYSSHPLTFNCGNRILKTFEAPCVVSRPWAIRTAPVPVGRVFNKSGEARN